MAAVISMVRFMSLQSVKSMAPRAGGTKQAFDPTSMRWLRSTVAVVRGKRLQLHDGPVVGLVS